MTAVPTIEASRVRLRDWNERDSESFAQMNADPRVTEFFAKSYTYERSLAIASQLRQELERDGYGWWVVERRDDGRFAGVVCLQPVPFDAPFTPANEIGWRFSVDAWGHGYATESAAAALGYAFASLKWDEVVAFTAAPNLRSQRVMNRIGMTHDPDDDFDHPRVEPGHRLRSHVLYRITAADWRRSTAAPPPTV